MSYIGHRCGCGDMDIHHVRKPGDTKRALCLIVNGHSCGRGCTVLADEPPEVVPTFNAHGLPVERIVPPGEGLATETGGFTVRTCACDACAALYATT